jgi:GT2 family glycosyltransferase
MFEDDDFSLRVRKAGFRVAGARDCFIHHFGQGSFRKLGQNEYQRIFDRNRARFEEKWQCVWNSHTPSQGIKPAADERRFEPKTFCQRRGGLS